jgi:hypothetical protein
MTKLLRLLPAVALLFVQMRSSPHAAAPPGPYFNGFENNTAGWFDITNGGDGTITRRPSGYTNGGGYANGIASAAGRWHARLTGDPCDHTPATDCFGPFTRWGGYSSTFPSGGYLTQVDIYLDVQWAATHIDYRFDWSSAINQNNGSHLRDFVFNVGTQPLGPPGFFVNASTNATRSGAFPENPCPSPNLPPNTCRAPAFISVLGWYTLRHTFRDDAGSLAVDFDIFEQSSGTPVAHWTIHPGDSMSIVGGNRYGWFVIEEIQDLAIDNSLRTGICHQGDGDGDFDDDRDGHRHHAHFHHDSCEDGRGDVENDDRDSGSHFQSSSVNSATFTSNANSQTLTMIGTGLHDGLPVGFTMAAVDNGVAPGIFTLILTDGYSTTGSLPSGSIVIR